MKKSTSHFAQILWIDNFPVTWMNFPANSKSIYLLKYALWNLKLNNSGQPANTVNITNQSLRSTALGVSAWLSARG